MKYVTGGEEPMIAGKNTAEPNAWNEKKGGCQLL